MPDSAAPSSAPSAPPAAPNIPTAPNSPAAHAPAPTPPPPYVPKRHPMLSGALVLLAIGLLIQGVMEFQRAADFAQRSGLSFSSLVNACMDGWTSSRTYTGIYVLAIA